MTVETTLLIDEEDLQSWERASLSVIEGEDGVNTENTKNVLLLILDDLINVNEESVL
ncbi:hypothetical protein CWI38_1698p0030 [Hamiltosporidium tvaerminnensis]|uniref:Uncharacterized protein n=1 Tax=Hamiltosporidium tvaerminnensis TaxID=1176355 RepID=A0A4Q9LPZ6_9MICR|nr:hypothetical protein CWI38_1698p0030 [Hamiltosporidium tvaerminnensis]